MLANIYGYQFNPCYEDVCFRFFSARTTSKVSFTLSREQRKAVFSYRAAEDKLQLPKIHLVINNRVSEYQLRFTSSLLWNPRQGKRVIKMFNFNFKIFGLSWKALYTVMFNVQGLQNSIFKVIEGFQSYGRYCFEDTLQSFPRQTRYLHDH